MLQRLHRIWTKLSPTLYFVLLEISKRLSRSTTAAHMMIRCPLTYCILQIAGPILRRSWLIYQLALCRDKRNTCFPLQTQAIANPIAQRISLCIPQELCYILRGNIKQTANGVCSLAAVGQVRAS